MEVILIYLAIALLDVATDGCFCVLARKRFRIKSAILAALFWPITLPLAIIGAVVATRDYPRW